MSSSEIVPFNSRMLARLTTGSTGRPLDAKRSKAASIV
jgi:hypothetical protein